YSLYAQNMVSFTVLASGSKGNCTVVSGGHTRILVDCGLSCRELFRRMKLAAERQAELDAPVEDCEHEELEAETQPIAVSPEPAGEPAPQSASDWPPSRKEDPTWLPSVEYF